MDNSQKAVLSKLLVSSFYPFVRPDFPFNAFVNDWLDQIEENILSRNLLRKGEALLVAVSGGLDSMVLLDVLAQLAPRQRWKLRVAHFNHQLRGRSSDADERLVRKVAEHLKVPISVGRGEVRQFAQSKRLSIEMAARQLRHEFLAKVARENKAKKVALAHHADDQLELFFLRLQRGAGSEGLSGMRWIGPSPFSAKVQLIRPLLGQTKEVIAPYARANKIAFREDASNQSTDFLRNRIRRELIPVLKQQEPPIFETALRSMEIIGTEGEFVAELARNWGKERKSTFTDLHIALQRRILHDQLREMGLPVDFALIERLRGSSGEPFSISQQCAVYRDEQGQVHCKESVQPAFRKGRAVVEMGKKGEFTFGEWVFSWERQPNSGGIPPRKACTEFFDADKVGARVTLRHWQPGDRFQPIGMPHEVKLQDWFVNLKVPAAERRKKVVAEAENGEIFWVEGSRISDRFKLNAATGYKLKWGWKSA